MPFRNEFLPRFQSEMIERNAIAMERLSLVAATDLLDSWIQRFPKETYHAAERINISADFYVKAALDRLAAARLEPTRYLNDNEETVVTHAMSLLNKNTVTRESIEAFMKTFGHRAPLDYELAEPRFSEDMNLVRTYTERSAHTVLDSEDKPGTPDNQDEERLSTGKRPAPPEGRLLAVTVQRARNFMRLKEEAKHYCLIELAQIQRLLLAIDEKCQLDGRVFQLHIDEVRQLADPEQRQKLSHSANQRFEASIAWKSLQLPASLSIRELERIDMLTGMLPDSVEQSELTGKRVAGKHEVAGRVQVITNIEQIHTFENGEILVARMTDPTWYPLCSQARGIVTEVGGWLSHAAIIAREYDLPAIFSVTGVCQRLQTGDIIRMHLSGKVEILENRRTKASAIPQPAVSDGVASSRPQPVDTVAVGAEEDVDPEASIYVYHLSSRRIFRSLQGIDRRAMKQQLDDRRAQPRLSASGDIVPDRRAVNRQAALELLKKAG